MKYVLALLVLFFALPAHAQIADTALITAVSPLYPKPNEPVFITLQSPVYNLEERTITWTSGGEVLLEGEGEMRLRLTAPAAGEQVTVRARISGTEDSITATVAPASVDLIWEADSYAPGLYRGRALPTIGSMVTFQAIPHILKGTAEVPASQLTFTWRKNGNVIATASGRGKASYTFQVGTFQQSDTISVTVSNTERTAAAESSVRIVPSEPAVRLYFEHPLYGIMYHQALPASTDVADTESTFAAVPYFVKASGPDDSKFSYMWRVNRQDVEPNAERPSVLTVSAGPSGGAAQIDLSLTHKNNYLFAGRGSWTVVFGSIAAPQIQTEQTTF